MLQPKDLERVLAEAIDPDAFASGDEGRQAVAFVAAGRAAGAVQRILRLLARVNPGG